MYTSCCPGDMHDYNDSRCDYAPIFMWREKSIHTSHIFLNFVGFFLKKYLVLCLYVRFKINHRQYTCVLI